MAFCENSPKLISRALHPVSDTMSHLQLANLHKRMTFATEAVLLKTRAAQLPGFFFMRIGPVTVFYIDGSGC